MHAVTMLFVRSLLDSIVEYDGHGEGGLDERGLSVHGYTLFPTPSADPAYTVRSLCLETAYGLISVPRHDAMVIMGEKLIRTAIILPSKTMSKLPGSSSVRNCGVF
jgi:hypothetical protein